MGIKKQEFYEGAALHILARRRDIDSLRYDPPFFVLNRKVSIYLKYSTKSRSPWGFTFTSGEQLILEESSSTRPIFIGLVCGADGVAAISYEDYRKVAIRKSSAIHVACYRSHGQHYEISGPDGTLDEKVAPSDWSKILEQ